MQIKSIRSALLIGVNSIVITILALTAWASYRNTLHELNELFDAELAQTARLLKSFSHDHGFLSSDEELTVIEIPAFIDDKNFATDNDGYRSLDGHKYETKLGFQVWRNNTLILASENALGQALSRFAPGYHQHQRDQQTWISFSYFDNSTGLWIFTAQRDDIRSELSGYLALDQLVALLMTWVPISLAILWLVNRVLLPVRSYATALGNRNADQLQQINSQLPQEIEPIRIAVNALFYRITEQIERERRFINDAAHELRTPLAALQLHASQLPDSQHASSKAVQKASQRMNHLVDQLFILAKADNPQAALGTPQSIDMNELVEQIIAELPVEALEKTQWQVTIPEHMRIIGYPTLLGAALRNLIENAIKYSGDKAEVSISVNDHDGSIAIIVADQGPGVDAEQLRHLGERFYRAEQHRQYGDGAGLGLSIAARVAALHGGKLEFALRQPHGLCAILTIEKTENYSAS